MRAGGFLVVLGLISCAAAASAQYSRQAQLDAPSTSKITVPVQVYQNPLEAAAVFVGDFPESLEGNQHLSVDVAKDPSNGSRLIIKVVMENLLDDATSAERHTIGLKRVSGGWQRGSYKLETRCARTGAPNEWGVGTCP